MAFSFSIRPTACQSGIFSHIIILWSWRIKLVMSTMRPKSFSNLYLFFESNLFQLFNSLLISKQCHKQSKNNTKSTWRISAIRRQNRLLRSFSKMLVAKSKSLKSKKIDRVVATHLYGLMTRNLSMLCLMLARTMVFSWTTKKCMWTRRKTTRK
jgi:hypothetical protein